MGVVVDAVVCATAVVVVVAVAKIVVVGVQIAAVA